jgi:pyrroline-5-carboxylate reductase
VLKAVLEEIGDVIQENQLLISVAAGVPLNRLQSAVRSSAPIVRVMPNTPSLVMAGAAALAAGSFAGREHVDRAKEMLDAVGQAVVVEEKYMDAVTGLSGSGPAYIFSLLEALVEGGVRMGLPRETARALALQTVVGAAELVRRTGLHPAELRDRVTSPGGTTAAGLFALEERAFKAAIMAAVEASARRSEELGAS